MEEQIIGYLNLGFPVEMYLHSLLNAKAAVVAQLVERFLPKPEMFSSKPVIGHFILRSSVLKRHENGQCLF